MNPFCRVDTPLGSPVFRARVVAAGKKYLWRIGFSSRDLGTALVSTCFGHLALKGKAFGSSHLQIDPVRSWDRLIIKAWKVKTGKVFSSNTGQSSRPSTVMTTTSPETLEKVQYKLYLTCWNKQGQSWRSNGRNPYKKTLCKSISLRIQSFIDTETFSWCSTLILMTNRAELRSNAKKKAGFLRSSHKILASHMYMKIHALVM